LGNACSSLLLEGQRWQQWYHFFLDGEVIRHCHHQSMNTCA
jgi:hypothetical protein